MGSEGSRKFFVVAKCISLGESACDREESHKHTHVGTGFS